MKREHLYVDWNHPLVLLSAFCMLASAVTAAFLMLPYCVWWITAVAVYLVILLLSGDELLYRTAIPIWILGLSMAFDSGTVLVWLGCLAFCISYTVIVSGWIKKVWLIPCQLAAIVCSVCFHGLSQTLAATGLLLLCPAMKVHNDEKYHPAWGDHIERRHVRTAPAMEQITAYFMPNRNGANNMFSESVEITELERYVRRKRREGLTGFGIIHVIMAAYVRTVAKYPALNRFIAGQKIYSRGEDIALCMTVKKDITKSSPDSVIKVHLHPGDTSAIIAKRKNVNLKQEGTGNLGATNTAYVMGSSAGIAVLQSASRFASKCLVTNKKLINTKLPRITVPWELLFAIKNRGDRCLHKYLLGFFWSRIRESNPRPLLGKRLFCH